MTAPAASVPGAPAAPAHAQPGDSRRWAVSLCLAVSGWLALAVAVAAPHSALRVAMVAVFVLAGPGAAVARLLPLRDSLARVVLAVALSLSLAAMTATAFSAGGVRGPTPVLAVLAAICSAAGLAELTRPGGDPA